MRAIKKLVFWQGHFSIHEAALLRNLATFPGIDVTLVVWEELPPRHAEKGWSLPDYGQTRIILRPTSQMQSALLSTDPSSTVHMFGGTRGHTKIWNAFREGVSLQSHIGVDHESYRMDGIKGALRFLRGRYDALRFAERIELILGIGTLAVEWSRRVGYPAEKIFPFAYFLEAPSFQNSLYSSRETSEGLFDLIFVGQIIPRKGWDILLKALHGLENLGWRLHVVGDGADRGRFAALCAESGLTDLVYFYGILPNQEVIDMIAKCDLLVLPSRWDGWGAVVNEALMCGVPVVCSNRCGAADLLDGNERGEVFASGNVSALRFVLGRRISQGKKDPVTSEKIREWSKCIDGKMGADYLLAVIEAVTAGGKRPIPPWFKYPES